MTICRAIGCNNPVMDPSQDFCFDCQQIDCCETDEKMDDQSSSVATPSLLDRKPPLFRSVEHLTEVDVFTVHHLFDMNDPSGALHHASRKLLLSGSGSGKKTIYDDIREARDTLTRWLEINALCH